MIKEGRAVTFPGSGFAFALGRKVPEKPMFCHLLVNISKLPLLVTAMRNSCIPPVPASIPLIPASFIPPHSQMLRGWICLSLRSWLYLSDVQHMWGGQTRLRGCWGSPSLTVPCTAAHPGPVVLSQRATSSRSSGNTAGVLQPQTCAGHLDRALTSPSCP